MAEPRAFRARLVRAALALVPVAAVAAVAVGAAGVAPPAAAQGESLERLFLNDLEERLAQDAFFKDVRVHLLDERAPLALYTQNPPNQRNKSFYLAWMHKLRDNLHDRFLRPLGARRRSTHAVTPVIVLANETWLRRYWKTRSENDDDFALSTYDEGLRAVVTCESSTAAWLRRQPVLRDLALGILDACSAPGVSATDDLWYRRGFAGYVSYHTGTRVSALDSYRPRRDSVDYLFEVLRKRERREALWIPLERLIGTRSLQSLDPRARGEDPSELEVFDDECALWVHFFHHAQDGKYREGASAFLARVLAGEGGGGAFEDCFGTRDMEAIEREFESYVFELYERLFVDRVASDDEPEEPEEAQPAPEIDLSALAREPSELEDVLALALWRARSGRLGEALERLEARAQSGQDGEAARLERELTRLRGLRAARDAFVQEALASGDRIRLQHAGGKVHDTLVSIDDGVLRFADEESPPVPLESIDSVSLALSLGSVPAENGGGWVRAYGLALAGDARWKRFLRDRGDVARALEEDAPEELPALVANGRALGALNDLGGTRTPTSPEEASAALELLAQVLGELRGEQQSLLEAHRDEITALARRALELRFLNDGVQSALAGDAEALEDGRLRVSYDFSDPAQIDDFVEVDDYLKWRVERLRREMPRKKFKVEKDTLRGTGFACLRHRLEFAAPMSVSYEFEFEKRKASPTDLAEVMLAICDDGEESYLGCYALGELHVDHQKLDSFDAIGRGEEPTTFRLGFPHPMAIRHDGERASTWRVDELCQETPVLGLTSGHVFLWIAVTGMLRVDNVVIEGTPLPRSLRELRDAWVGAELTTLGLGDDG